eukprot:TRINITY_DN23443_c0_g1_i2.p1 TRINITY_DN23443_c0_g1~~TRINITY_DN23443_c0_g1_i2.p1  ORF type:complete len:178 (+),score=31.64 TRINITY_DN23443_c0_g1_i2:89-622(+)
MLASFLPRALLAAAPLRASAVGAAICIPAARYAARSASFTGHVPKAPSYAQVRASPSMLVDHADGLLAALSARFPAFVLTQAHSVSCIRAKKLLRDLGVRFQVVALDGLSRDERMAMAACVPSSSDSGPVPRIYVGGTCLGGFPEVQQLHSLGELVPRLVAAGVAQPDLDHGGNQMI